MPGSVETICMALKVYENKQSSYEMWSEQMKSNHKAIQFFLTANMRNSEIMFKLFITSGFALKSL